MRRLASLLGAFILINGCSTLPTPKLHRYGFPENAHFDVPKREHEGLGLVRAKASYNSLSSEYEESLLCKNFFNKAVQDLVKYAKAQGADAVVEVRSVTFLLNGESELHPSPQCADDGEEGQVLVQGVAVKWKNDDEPKKALPNSRHPKRPRIPKPTPVPQRENSRRESRDSDEENRPRTPLRPWEVPGTSQ